MVNIWKDPKNWWGLLVLMSQVELSWTRGMKRTNNWCYLIFDAILNLLQYVIILSLAMCYFKLHDLAPSFKMHFRSVRVHVCVVKTFGKPIFWSLWEFIYLFEHSSFVLRKKYKAFGEFSSSFSKQGSLAMCNFYYMTFFLNALS